MNNDGRALVFLIRRYAILLAAWLFFAAGAYILLSIVADIFNDPFVVYAYVFVSVALFYAAMSFIIKILVKRINDLLNVFCDPEKYIAIYTSIKNEYSKKKKYANIDHCLINLSSGLIAAGRYDEALKTLGKISRSGSARNREISNIIYCLNACTACLWLGRIEEAENHLDQLIKHMASLCPADYKKYEKYLKMAQYRVNMAQGNFTYAEKAFEQAFSSAMNTYEKVVSKFYLGQTYVHIGDTERARDTFKYVTAHGNKLYIAAEAKRIIAQISG